MIVRLVADIQNRLFWRGSALVGLLSAAFPLRDGARCPRWAAMCRLSSACTALILCVAADRGLDRGDFPEPAEGTDVWFEPT